MFTTFMIDSNLRANDTLIRRIISVMSSKESSMGFDLRRLMGWMGCHPIPSSPDGKLTLVAKLRTLSEHEYSII